MASKQDGVQGFEATEWEKNLQILGFLEWTTMGYIYIYLYLYTVFDPVCSSSHDQH